MNITTCYIYGEKSCNRLIVLKNLLGCIGEETRKSRQGNHGKNRNSGKTLYWYPNYLLREKRDINMYKNNKYVAVSPLILSYGSEM